MLTVLGEAQGRHAGLLRGSRKHAGLAQPGNAVAATWRARLTDQLGSFSIESERSFAAAWLDDPLRLAALTAACAVASAALPEREPHPAVFHGLWALAEALETPHWPAIYVRWEIGLLAELGYGLELGVCAATGRNDQLGYVSPRTGRAVCLSAGEPYKDRLLPLPGFLIGQGDDTPEAVRQGLQLTGYFIERVALGVAHKPMPAARLRLAERLSGASR